MNWNLLSSVSQAHNADLEYNPSDWPKMLEIIERGAARLVYGSRTKSPTRRGYLHYVVGASFLTEIFNVLWRKNLSDLYTGSKMFQRELVDSSQIERRGMPSCRNHCGAATKKKA